MEQDLEDLVRQETNPNREYWEQVEAINEMKPHDLLLIISRILEEQGILSVRK